ncbi:MAG: flagellar basal body P-ring formation chaperone FlgA [Planctomycetaceae bacterium]
MNLIRFLICGLTLCAGTFVLAADEASRPDGIDAETAIIRLKDEATVGTTLVYLGDCAQIVTDNRQLKMQLERLPLFPAPLGGREVSLDYDWLSKRLTAHGINLAQIEFTGSPTVAIRGTNTAEKIARPRETVKQKVIQQVSIEKKPKTATVIESLTNRERERAERVAVDLIRRELLKHNADWKVAEIQVSISDDDIRLIDGAVRDTVRIHSSADAETIDGGFRQLWMLSLNDAVGAKQTVDVAAEILTPPQILVVARDLPAGHILQADDLEWGFASKRNIAVVDWEQIAGKEIVRPMKKSQPIQSKDVRAQILVKHGEIVSVSVRQPGIRVRREFKSNGQGGLGDVIGLTSLDGRQRIRATVSGLHEAEIFADPAASRATPMDAAARHSTDNHKERAQSLSKNLDPDNFKP